MNINVFTFSYCVCGDYQTNLKFLGVFTKYLDDPNLLDRVNDQFQYVYPTGEVWTPFTYLVSEPIRAQYDLCCALIGPDTKFVKSVWNSVMVYIMNSGNKISIKPFNLLENDWIVEYVKIFPSLKQATKHQIITTQIFL